MAKFSDRIGVTHLPNQLQLNEMSDELRNSIWNHLVPFFNGSWQQLVTQFFVQFFKRPMDELPSYNVEVNCRKWLYEEFMDLEWYEIYNFVEYILQHFFEATNNRLTLETFETGLNAVLVGELSAYRIINYQLVPISQENEIEAIRDAIFSGEQFGGVGTHLKNALHLIGKKPEPDYRNSIKESISAVEGLCKTLTGEKSGGIDKALSILASKTQIHSALKSGLSNLYGYTSDEDGIRHPILEASDVGFAEAKFMLVSCSSFVNYLIDKARQAKLV